MHSSRQHARTVDKANDAGTLSSYAAIMSVWDRGWWDDDGFAAALPALLDPVRVPYFLSVLRHRPGVTHVLDVGCGGGVTAQGLALEGFTVVGVDPSLGAIAEATRHADGVSFAVSTGEVLPFPDDGFDAVLCTEVLEHVSNPAAVVAEIGRVLRPGGVFLFSTPNRTLLSRLVLIDLAQRWRLTAVLPNDLHEWHRFLTPRELGRITDAAGIETESISGVGVRASSIPAAIAALAGVRLGRLSHRKAAERIELHLSPWRAIAYIGHGFARPRT